VIKRIYFFSYYNPSFARKVQRERERGGKGRGRGREKEREKEEERDTRST